MNAELAASALARSSFRATSSMGAFGAALLATASIASGKASGAVIARRLEMAMLRAFRSSGAPALAIVWGNLHIGNLLKTGKKKWADLIVRPMKRDLTSMEMNPMI
jgi:hypothetical protein